MDVVRVAVVWAVKIGYHIGSLIGCDVSSYISCLKIRYNACYLGSHGQISSSYNDLGKSSHIHNIICSYI